MSQLYSIYNLKITENCKKKQHIVSVLLDSNKVMSKHLLSRRQSSPSSSTSMNLINDNSKMFEFDKLFEAIQLSSGSQKDATACGAKSR